jgi:hypothetical protein
MCAYFFSSLIGCWFFSNFVIFRSIKVAKHIWEPCCHLAAETGSYFPLIDRAINEIKDFIIHKLQKTFSQYKK